MKNCTRQRGQNTALKKSSFYNKPVKPASLFVLNFQIFSTWKPSRLNQQHVQEVFQSRSLVEDVEKKIISHVSAFSFASAGSVTPQLKPPWRNELAPPLRVEGWHPQSPGLFRSSGGCKQRANCRRGPPPQLLLAAGSAVCPPGVACSPPVDRHVTPRCEPPLWNRKQTHPRVDDQQQSLFVWLILMFAVKEPVAATWLPRLPFCSPLRSLSPLSASVSPPAVSSAPSLSPVPPLLQSLSTQ